MNALKTTLTALFLSLAIAGCDGGSGSGDSTATTAYTISNGQCYSGSTVVDYNYCTSLSNYYQVNSYCYNTDGSRVADSYCSNSGYLNLQPRQCNNGRFFMPRKGKMHEVNCRSRNCKNNLMFDDRGKPVHCR